MSVVRCQLSVAEDHGPLTTDQGVNVMRTMETTTVMHRTGSGRVIAVGRELLETPRVPDDW